MPAIISTAEVTDAEAIHPGYGFLSENADFAERVERSGFTFIGPTPEAIRIMGDKVVGQAGDDQVGRAVRAGLRRRAARRPERDRSRRARAIGYPVIIKAAGGGGGRGMRVVHTEAALVHAVQMTQRRGRRGLRQSGRLHGEVPPEPAPHRDPGPRRQAQERGLAGRARLLDAAAPPEDHRGSAGAGHPAPRDRDASASAAPPPARRSATAAPARSSSCTRTASSSSSR